VKRDFWSVIALLILSFAHAQSGPTSEGVLSVQSPYDVTETLDKLAVTAEAKGFTIIARVDHAAAASNVDMSLRPTELLIFGNPKGGTPLMVCQQSFGLDLPLKALAWQDESGQVWLSYNDMSYLATRHQAEGCGEAIDNVSQGLAGIVQEALQ
jgi:uncharacterized protein (DUF302 family)